MDWNVYLSGEIHTDWRERIIEGARALPVTFSSPVTDHAASDAAGDHLGEHLEGFWRDHRSASVNAIRTRTLIEHCDIAVIRFGEQYRQWNAAFDAGFCAEGLEAARSHCSAAEAAAAGKARRAGEVGNLGKRRNAVCGGGSGRPMGRSGCPRFRVALASRVDTRARSRALTRGQPERQSSANGRLRAPGKPYVTLHDEALVHALKEVDAAALAWAQTPEQVVELLAYTVGQG